MLTTLSRPSANLRPRTGGIVRGLQGAPPQSTRTRSNPAVAQNRTGVHDLCVSHPTTMKLCSFHSCPTHEGLALLAMMSVNTMQVVYCSRVQSNSQMYRNSPWLPNIVLQAI